MASVARGVNVKRAICSTYARRKETERGRRGKVKARRHCQRRREAKSGKRRSQFPSKMVFETMARRLIGFHENSRMLGSPFAFPKLKPCIHLKKSHGRRTEEVMTSINRLARITSRRWRML